MRYGVLEEVGHGEMGGYSAQKTLPGLETTYEPIRGWEIKQNCHIDHRAMKGFSANTDVLKIH